MGIMNSIYGAFGLESSKDAKKRNKKKKNKGYDRYEGFSYAQRTEEQEYANNLLSGLNLGGGQDVVIINPKNNEDIQKAVDMLRQNQAVIINLNDISDTDLNMVMYFLSGAVYALNGSIHNYMDGHFIITPEGRKILVQKGERR